MNKQAGRQWGIFAPLIILVGSSLLTGFRLPTPSPDCKQQVLAAYHRLLGDGQLNSNKVYHLRFSSTSRYQAPGQRGQREVTVHGDLYYQGRRCYFQTERLRLWQDEHYVATVLPAQRTVFLTQVALKQQGLNAAQLLGLRDSLLLLGTLQQCTQQLQDKQVSRHVRLTYPGKAGAQLHLKGLDFWLTAAQKLQQVRVEYRPGGAVQETTLQFPLLEWLASSAELPNDARQKVLTPQGRLLPEFDGYRLVNQISPGH
jgi:hypothetical protein